MLGPLYSWLTAFGDLALLDLVGCTNGQSKHSIAWRYGPSEQRRTQSEAQR